LLDRHYYTKDAGQRLPRLLAVQVEAVGPADPSFNCYGYAADADDPPGWVGGDGPREIPAGAAGFVIKVSDYGGMVGFYDHHGWTPLRGVTGPAAVSRYPAPRPGEERVVLYVKDGKFKHAALWTSHGVYAKMGDLGTFRFDSLNQMAGGFFGEPWVVLQPK